MRSAIVVGAAEQAFHMLRQIQTEFVHHFVVGNHVHRGIGREQGQAVGLFGIKAHVFHFDDVFVAHVFAAQIKAHGHAFAQIV